MNDFHIKIKIISEGGKLQYLTEYFWVTDCRKESITEDLPITKIINWLKS